MVSVTPLALSAHAQQAGSAAAVAAPPSFPIEAIDVSGVSKLPASEVERLIYPFVGLERTSADVEKARKAIQDAYTARGYEAVVVEVPPQLSDVFARGLIQIKVNEAPVGLVRVTGSKYHALTVVRRNVPSLVEGQPVEFQTLQTHLAAANRFPDRSVTPSFKAGKVPGTIDVDLKVKDSLPLHASIELNNDNSPNTVPLRLSGTVRYSNLWQAGHTLSVSAVTAPERRSDSEVFSLSYSAPLIGTPWTLVAYGYTSNSDIAALGGTQVLGDGYQVGARAVYRLPTEKAYHAFTVGLDYKDFNQDISVRGTTVSRAPIRYIPLSLGYTFSQSGEKSSVEVNLNTTLGLRTIKRVSCLDPDAVVCRPEDQFTNKDIDSQENFVHLNLDATYTRAIIGDLVAEAKVSGQFADSHLVTNEQYGIGGLSSVRGYFQSEVVGDNGLAGSLEIRAPSLAGFLPSFVDELRVFGFAEGGIVRVIDPLPDQDGEFTIGSVGGGVRIKFFNHLSGEVSAGVPLTDGPSSRQGDPRVTFVAKGEF